jgi:N-acetylglucosamine-6-sulfatase
MDENIGRLLDAMDQHGLAENTVIIFTSDNGYYLGEHGLGDYMGDKRSPYEEAMRVPMLVRYPNGNAAGSVSDALTLNIDLAPTLLDMAGVAIPDEIQGQSWAKLLAKPNSKYRKGFFYEYFFETKFSENPTMLAYRTEDAKIIKYPGHEDWTELFDLKNDPYERKNLTSSPEHRTLLKRMEKAFEAEKKAVGYHVPDYAEPVAPHGTLPTRKKQRYHWLDREN